MTTPRRGTAGLAKNAGGGTDYCPTCGKAAGAGEALERAFLPAQQGSGDRTRRQLVWSWPEQYRRGWPRPPCCRRGRARASEGRARTHWRSACGLTRLQGGPLGAFHRGPSRTPSRLSPFPPPFPAAALPHAALICIYCFPSQTSHFSGRASLELCCSFLLLLIPRTTHPYAVRTPSRYISYLSVFTAPQPGSGRGTSIMVVDYICMIGSR